MFLASWLKKVLAANPGEEPGSTPQQKEQRSGQAPGRENPAPKPGDGGRSAAPGGDSKAQDGQSPQQGQPAPQEEDATKKDGSPQGGAGAPQEKGSSSGGASSSGGGEEKSPEEQANELPPLSTSLEWNIAAIKVRLGESEDIKYHRFTFGQRPGSDGYRGVLIFVDGLVDGDAIAQSVLRPLISGKEWGSGLAVSSLEEIQRQVLYSGDSTCEDELKTLMEGILSGDTVLLVEGFAQGLVISTKSWDKRGVSEPQTESVVRGPREGFTENFRTNTSMIRRRIKSPHLRMEHMVIGQRTGTNVCLCYLEGVVRPDVVESVRQRLESISVDGVLDSSYLEQYIEDAPRSVYSTVGYTEKPDVATAKILEGRVGIISDGSPFVLTVPTLFIESFQTAEDYYVWPFYASIIRLLRFLSYAIAIFAVPAYIALTTFHKELIPTTLLITIASAREGTPFPALLEALTMVLSFEILREAGLRLPRPVGQAVSIVGALIMGDAAVSAGLVGAPMVITVALTSVAGFIVPGQDDAISLVRLMMMFLASMLGGYGIAIGLLAILVHLASLKSFGVPFFSGVLPTADQQDTFIRLPLWMMEKRPKVIAGEDKVRKTGWKPGPQGGGNNEKQPE